MSSSKIPLYLKSIPSSDGITVTRVVANVGFLGNDGRYAIKDIAIIDTGAPVSLIPFEVWSWCPVELGEKRVIQSVSGREARDADC